MLVCLCTLCVTAVTAMSTRRIPGRFAGPAR